MLGFLLFTYGAVATPRAQRHGMIGLMPDTMIVLSLPFLSDEPGSAMSFLNSGLSGSAYEEQVLDRFSSDHSTLGMVSSDLGWHNRRLVFWLAKRQSTSAVTDASAARGNIFRSLISKMLLRGHTTTEEAEWANSMIHIEFDNEGPVSLDMVAYSGFKARRLKHGAYRLMIGRNQALYNGYTQRGMSFQAGGGRGLTTNEEFIEAFRWDNTYKIAQSGGVIRDSEFVALGKPYKADEHTGAFNVKVIIVENEARPIDGEQWTIVSNSHKQVELPISESLTIPEDAKEEVGKELQRTVQAKLTVTHDPGSGKWIPTVELNRRYRSGRAEYDGMLFGGDVSVVMYMRKKGQDELSISRGIPILKGESQVWRWTGSGKIESSLIKPNTVLGQVEYAGFSLPNSIHYDYEFRVRLDPRSINRTSDYGGLTGWAMYPYVLEFPLEDWTEEEMIQFIVNGTVPDHSMP
jgi:hypothetical protein